MVRQWAHPIVACQWEDSALEPTSLLKTEASSSPRKCWFSLVLVMGWACGPQGVMFLSP